ncbi:MAG: hypothetical protein PGN27_13420 [Mycolicibacterium neoaurum]|uniref:hypothetical protein n=1 Tax=Mycolicibacterium neoaurum TaxID=1795 RepID=UPI002FFD42CF
MDVLADGLGAYRLGQAAFALIFPTVGVLLLVVGMLRRRAFNRWNSSDDDRLLAPEASSGGDDTVTDPYGEFDGLPEDLPPRPSRPSGKGTVPIVVGVVLLVLGAAHVFSALVSSGRVQSTGNVAVGQCITAQAYDQGRMNSEPVDCRRSDATMELVSKGDSTATCPDGLRRSPIYPALTNEVRTHCFMLNLRENQCYAIGGTVTPTNCTEPGASIRVARRIDGASEAVGCPADARVVSYTDPARVYCFVAP